jgi:hypothetical protein
VALALTGGGYRPNWGGYSEPIDYGTGWAMAATYPVVYTSTFEPARGPPEFSFLKHRIVSLEPKGKKTRTGPQKIDR